MSYFANVFQFSSLEANTFDSLKFPNFRKVSWIKKGKWKHFEKNLDLLSHMNKLNLNMSSNLNLGLLVNLAVSCQIVNLPI